MTEEKHTKTDRGRFWLRLALGLSLALNLLVVGFVAGALLRPRDGHRTEAGARPLGVTLFRSLPREDRRALRAEMREMADRMRPAPDTERLQALDAALRAQPFDPVALDRLVTESHAHRQDWQQQMHRAWLDRVAQMTDAERAGYAQRLREAFARRPGDRDE